MEEAVRSNNGIVIRLTDERWAHITEELSELAGMRFDVLESLALPEQIYKGDGGELFAVREIETGKYLVVIYREIGIDGFIITAFSTRRFKSLEKRELLWSAQK